MNIFCAEVSVTKQYTKLFLSRSAQLNSSCQKANIFWRIQLVVLYHGAIMKLEVIHLFFVNIVMTVCQRADLKVHKSLLPGPTFPIGGLPLFDEHIKGQLILRHKFVLKFQLRCVLMGAQCDIIGRWLKPRVEKIFVENKCESCTPTQTKLVYTWVNKFIDDYPDMFRAALAKYAENLGIKLPPDERRKMIQILGEDP